MISSILTALAIELIVANGSAKMEMCGTNGCWRQPPAPFKFEGKSDYAAIGFRLGDVEVQYQELGRGTVHGKFSADQYYDSDKARFTEPCIALTPETVKQHDTGVSVTYAPRWEKEGFSVSPNIGLTLLHSTLLIYNDLTPQTAAYEESHGFRVTPTTGVRVGYSIEQIYIGYGVQFWYRPRYRNSAFGGGGDYPIGKRAQFVEFRVAF